jgi:MFS family permease
MTTRSTWAVAYLIWAVGVIPGALVVMWLGLVDWSWRGFAIAFVVLAVMGLAYEALVCRVERLRQRRRERRGAASNPER